MKEHACFVIERVNSDISYEEFKYRFFDPEIPVIIENVARNWPALQVWNADYLAQHIANNKSIEPHIAFYNADLSFLNDDYVTPNIIQTILASSGIMARQKVLRFWLSKKNHVTEWHYESFMQNVFNVQIVGRKKWMLTSPTTPLVTYPFSNIAIVKQRNKTIKGRISCSFILNSGDMLYLPPLWGHKVESLAEENISINWTMTKIQNHIISHAFKREVERYILFSMLQNSKYIILKSLYKLLYQLMPSYADISWPYDTFIKTTNTVTKLQILKRFIVELTATIPAFFALKSTWLAMKKIKDTELIT